MTRPWNLQDLQPQGSEVLDLSIARTSSSMDKASNVLETLATGMLQCS